MNADGSNQRNLTRNPAKDVRPSWSPDGRRIAFVSDRDGRLEAHVMNADGSGQRSLTLQER
jgi:TolB protein